MAATPSGGDRLSTYRAKRSAERTPEPSGVLSASPGQGGGLFVVHQHAATRLHFDLRLEMHGVLASWAVPKGPSKDAADKRYAVHVEDHPLEYGDFEGIIPEGNYGAGAVIVWDRGRWVPIEDPDRGMEKGKLLFELKGHKLRGRWTLVKLKKDPKGWLLIKERDGHMTPGRGDDFPPQSVLSGLTVEELKRGVDRAAALREELSRSGARSGTLKPKQVSPMLCQTREAPFSRKGWLFELKLDGYRILAHKSGDRAMLLSRNGNDLTATFPEVARAVAALPYDGLVLDGEVVVHDERGLPSFTRLQQRGRLTRPEEARRAAVELPAVYYVFDCLAAEGYDLRELPLTARKALTRRIIPAAGALRYLDHFEADGEALFNQVERMGLEGIVAKRADSPYRSRRSADWIKVRAERVGDFVVVGFSRPKGSRTGFGALHLGGYHNGQLVYVGRVGSGFTAKQVDEIATLLAGHRIALPPFSGPAPATKDDTWVEPLAVAEVRFKEWTGEGLLRHPVFLRFRDDKLAHECGVERAVGEAMEVDEVVEEPPSPPSPPFTLSNLDKLFWPEEGYTKGDVINYYRQIAPWLLPYLNDRPLVLTRYPDGITGKSFFQKDAPQYAQDFVRTVTMWSEESRRNLDYFVCDSAESLVYIANMGAIPLHIWASRVATLERPDWCILDLDPKGAPLADVVTVARHIKKLCDGIELPAFIKTSGSSGLHVLLPLGRQCTYEQSRHFGGLLARLVAADLPEIATVVRQVHKREGKVYIDYVQNGQGRLLAAPFSLRPVPGALVSAPLEWKEVTAKLDLAKFTIRTMPRRMERLGGDPLLPVLEEVPDLPGALQRLHERVQRSKARK
ncbi:MAG TPA: DNA ligase D [Gemmatimonadales bacterium]|nr:DNA ligase D [Gemmatimonadales bacterium]